MRELSYDYDYRAISPSLSPSVSWGKGRSWSRHRRKAEGGSDYPIGGITVVVEEEGQKKVGGTQFVQLERMTTE